MAISQVIPTVKPHYEFVDTMKGICIILVIVHHLVGRTIISPLYFTMFRMPLYFMLSGIFFSMYSCPREFLVKKFNNLLVPYFFTWLLVRLHTGIHYGQWDMDVIKYNVSIWFLMALFELAILMYLIMLLPHEWMRVCLVVSIFVLGYVFSQRPHFVMMPMWLNAVSCAVPFYYVGHQARKLKVLAGRSRWWDLLWLMLSLVTFAILVYLYPKMYIDLRNNKIFTSCPVFLLAGLSGTSVVFFLSKLVGRIPLISYYGRYSIVALCTHIFLFRLLNEYGVLTWMQRSFGISNQVWRGEKVGAWIACGLVVFLTLPLVYLLTRHIPFLVSQTPLLDPRTGKFALSLKEMWRTVIRGKK